MNEKKTDTVVQTTVTDEDQNDQGETISQGNGDDVEKKPIEEMSKDELIQELEKIQEKADKYYDQYLRSQAEMENLAKRTKKEKEDWIKYSNETLIKDLLPVMDNLEKAISFTNNQNPLDAIKEGVELTLKNFKDTLIKSGLEEIEALGKPFDPAYHHAVSEQISKNVEQGVILQELQKGYMLNQRLIRPAMVILSKGDPEKGDNH
ncbi:MAG: nucleotide exchange factor GrpE [Deltaproteobacteria bacterium]|nr:nucleotide exchange factor GrpE [Deltaproteobacteria bacterium]